MARERKWMYWHRVIWADNETEEGAELKVGNLLGLSEITPSCARAVTDEVKKSIDIKDYVKLRYLGKMLRTATAKEVHDAFKDV